VQRTRYAVQDEARAYYKLYRLSEREGRCVAVACVPTSLIMYIYRKLSYAHSLTDCDTCVSPSPRMPCDGPRPSAVTEWPVHDYVCSGSGTYRYTGVYAHAIIV